MSSPGTRGWRKCLGKRFRPALRVSSHLRNNLTLNNPAQELLQHPPSGLSPRPNRSRPRQRKLETDSHSDHFSGSTPWQDLRASFFSAACPPRWAIVRGDSHSRVWQLGRPGTCARSGFCGVTSPLSTRSKVRGPTSQSAATARTGDRPIRLPLLLRQRGTGSVCLPGVPTKQAGTAGGSHGRRW